jgi:hypothetical protein
MKKTMHIVLAAITLCIITGNAMAISIESIDKVSVMIPRSTVLDIMGNPDEVGKLGFGLTADIYGLKGTDPLVGIGCIYDENQMLTGQVFVFSGTIAKETVGQIKMAGFTILEDKDNSFRLAGKDDDTGQPLVVVVKESEGLTIVMTFEKSFYERRIKD